MRLYTDLPIPAPVIPMMLNGEWAAAGDWLQEFGETDEEREAGRWVSTLLTPNPFSPPAPCLPNHFWLGDLGGVYFYPGGEEFFFHPEGR